VFRFQELQTPERHHFLLDDLAHDYEGLLADPRSVRIGSGRVTLQRADTGNTFGPKSA
jgi:hypothetical protein